MRRHILAITAFLVYSLVLVNNLPAPPGPPADPVPAGGELVQGVTVGIVALYGAWKIRSRK